MKHTEKLYNINSTRWRRNKPICLSDFTARDKIFKIAGNLKNKVVADLGCGEGYCSEKFKNNGAKKVYGIDISQKMIELANSRKIKKIIFKKASITKTGLKKNLSDRTFAIFVFNYLKKKEIIKACKEMFRITKKNGLVYVSVPHPFYPFLSKKNDTFFFKALKSIDYLKKKDEEFSGYISRIDNIKLPVKINHHTFEDYFDAFKASGFKTMIDFKELNVTKNLLNKNFNFFSRVKDLPLHVLFVLKKI
jgi:ubiquinone/menaquinone biosynthesis C-methylase UbiE